MSLGKRIKKARLLAGLSQEALAYSIGQYGDRRSISRTAIAQWESGATKEIEASNLLKAARVLDVDPEWLLFDSKKSGIWDFSQRKFNGRKIPIINFIQAMDRMPIDNHSIYTSIDAELAAVSGPRVFAIEVWDESMQPEMELGDLILIDPDITPLPGEIILVKVLNKNGSLLGRYHPLCQNSHADVNFEIIPTNQYWPRITFNPENPAKILGTLIEHRCRRRLPRAK